MEKTLTLTMADGTVLEDIGLNGDNYISSEPIDDSVFSDEALKAVEVYDSETKETTTLINQSLAQNIEFQEEYWFTFYEKSAAELLAEKVEAQEQTINDLSERVEQLESAYPYVIAQIDAFESPGGDSGGPSFSDKVKINKTPENQFEEGYATIENFKVGGENLGTVTVGASAVYNEGIAGSIGADVCDKLVGNIEIIWNKDDFSTLYAYIDNETEEDTPPFSWDSVTITMTDAQG